MEWHCRSPDEAYTVYAILGDGEIQEGQVEAAMFAPIQTGQSYCYC